MPRGPAIRIEPISIPAEGEDVIRRHMFAGTEEIWPTERTRSIQAAESAAQAARTFGEAYTSDENRRKVSRTLDDGTFISLTIRGRETTNTELENILNLVERVLGNED